MSRVIFCYCDEHGDPETWFVIPKDRIRRVKIDNDVARSMLWVWIDDEAAESINLDPAGKAVEPDSQLDRKRRAFAAAVIADLLYSPPSLADGTTMWTYNVDGLGTWVRNPEVGSG